MIEVIVRKGEQGDKIIDLTSSKTFSTNEGPRVSKRDLIFVTGNSNKYTELKGYFQDSNISLIQRDIDLTEIQHEDPLKIVEEKCRSAYQLLKSNATNDKRCSIVIEDTSVGFESWKWLPGPYIKWFLKAMGPAGLYQMLSSYSNKRAIATCTYAVMEDLNEIVFCRGSVLGEIVSPRGANGFGWDSCFQETESCRTFGEMNDQEKRKLSHRANAVLALKYYLLGERPPINTIS